MVLLELLILLILKSRLENLTEASEETGPLLNGINEVASNDEANTVYVWHWPV